MGNIPAQLETGGKFPTSRHEMDSVWEFTHIH